MTSSWTGGRKRLKPQPSPTKKTLIASPMLFIRRDKHGVALVDDPNCWSESVLQQASAVWEEVLIFYIGVTATDALEAAANLQTFIDNLKISNIAVVLLPDSNIENRTSIMKACLVERGARIKLVRNPREVTYLNLRKFVDAPHMTWAGPDDYRKAKLDPDKVKSFRDLQDIRKVKAAW